MTLELTPLANAIDRLREGLGRHLASPRDDQLRDGLIQRFEFTYELSHRTLRRFLAETVPNPETLDQSSFADLIREGSRQGVLKSDWPAWRRFREMRAKTSHTYDPDIAKEVVADIPLFLDEATHLLAQLRARAP